MAIGTRITIKLRNNDEHLTMSTAGGGNRSITFRNGDGVGASAAMDNGQFRDQATNGTMLNAVATSPNTLRTGNGGTNTPLAGLRAVKITLPEVLAERVMRLIQFQSKIKDKGVAAGTRHHSFTIHNVFYNDAGAADANPGNTLGTIVNDDGNSRFDLTHDNSFTDGNNLAVHVIDDWDKVKKVIDISVVDYSKTLNDGTYLVKEFSHEIDILEKTEKLITDLETKYVKNELPAVTEIEGDLRELKVYADATAAPYADNAADVTDENLKKIIYDLDVQRENIGLGTAGNAKFYKLKIDPLIKKITEFLVWRKCGVDEIDNILRANANGFKISNRGVGTANPTICATGVGTPWSLDYSDATANGGKANVDGIIGILANGKYRGFPIYDETQVVGTAVDASDTLMVGNADKSFAGHAHFTKTQIDDFYKIFIIDPTNTDKSNYRGFKPSDALTVSVTPGNQADNTSNPKKEATEATYNTKNIMDKALPPIKGRLDGKKVTATDTANEYKNDNLQFTKCIFDVVGNTADKDVARDKFFATDFDTAVGTKKSVLDLLFIAIQDAAWTGGFDYSAAGTTDDDRKKIFAAYNKMKAFLTVYDVDYSTYDESKKDELADISTNLLEYKNATSGNDKFINGAGTWTKLIDEKIGEINQAIKNKKPSGPPGKDLTVADIKAKVNALVLTTTNNDEKELIKKMFDNTTEIIKGKQALLDKLVELATMIDKVFKDGTSVEKSKLEAIRDDKTGQGAKAWELTKAVKDKNGKDLTSLALEKATGKPKKDDAAKLAAAKVAAKTAMKAKMATGGEDAYNKIVDKSTTLTSKELVEDTVKIFEKCYDAWKETKENDKLRNDLAEYENATSGEKQTVWTAINSFTKNADNGDCTEGFGKGALKHLQGLVKEREKIVEKSEIDKAGDATAAKKALGILKESKDKDSSKKIEEIVIPRAELMVALFEKGDNDSAELAKLIGKNFTKKLETDYDDSTFKANLEILEKKLKELKEFKSGGKDKVYKGLGDNEKKTFDSLIDSLEGKVKSMQEKKNKEEKNDNPNSTETPFLKSWKGILLIGVIIAIVLGAVAYFIKTNSSEEGEGE